MVELPKELYDIEQLEKLLPKALELRVVRDEKDVKLKIRTPEYLYTLKTNEQTVQGFLKNAKDLQVIEIGQKKEEKQKEGKAEDKKSD